MAKQKHVRGIYRSFNFKDHHPVLDAIDRIYELAGVPRTHRGNFKLSYVAEKSDVTEGTLRRWRTRETKRPQDAAVEAVLRGLGAERVIRYQGNIIRYGTSIRPTTLTVVEGERTRRRRRA